MLCYTQGMKARPAKSNKRTLHQPPAEMVEALSFHNEGWAKAMEDERRRHEPERQADYRQPYRMNQDKLRDCYCFNGRTKKKLVRLWKSQGLNVASMMEKYGFNK